MRDDGKAYLLGIGIDRCDYEGAVARILGAAREMRPLSVSALAVHGVMTGVGPTNRQHRWRLNHLDLVTPDGQPVRWALNLFYGARLRERVYGPRLTELLLDQAAAEGLPVYFYGNDAEGLSRLVAASTSRWPDLIVAGAEPSRFGPGDPAALAGRIGSTEARLVFVGLGCPRQEVLAYELRPRLDVPVIAVGAAFDYHGGTLAQPPAWVQRAGLQWFYRLCQEPRRLWRRYLLLNPAFLALVVAQRLGWRPDRTGVEPRADGLVEL